MARRNAYSESEMLRMQRDAEARVREMHNRARKAAEDANESGEIQTGRNNRNWSQTPGVTRAGGWQTSGVQLQPPEGEEKLIPILEELPPVPVPEIEKEPTTMLQDILDAIGLDDDRLLILGLLFILINAKADTTLILALIYLLI